MRTVDARRQADVELVWDSYGGNAAPLLRARLPPIEQILTYRRSRLHRMGARGCALRHSTGVAP
jgi:hypothetical protein